MYQEKEDGRLHARHIVGTTHTAEEQTPESAAHNAGKNYPNSAAAPDQEPSRARPSRSQVVS